MLEILQLHLDKNLPFLKGKKLLIAISGGVDSVVLTQLFHSLNYTISLAHCNFNLRDLESNKDEKFVKNLGKQLNRETFTTSFNTNKYASLNKTSTQIAARELRYNWFQKLAEENKFDYILTAHHVDDNLETFLINLSRGSGLEGFTGIPAINKNIIRPLLIFSREEIEKYASTHKIEWREDLSNASSKYIRNKIRHQIIPVLKELNPSLLDTFQKTTNNLKGSQQIINSAIEQVKEKILVSNNEILKFDISEIKKLPNTKAYLFEILKPYSFTEWNDIDHLLTAQSGKQVFSKTHRLLKDRDFLFLSEKTSIKTASEYFIEKNTTQITEPISLSFEIGEKSKLSKENSISIDLETITFPLTLRKWKHGDFFYPKGMTGKKKISKFFKDEKLSLLEKENSWLLCSRNQIVWVVGKRADHRFLGTKKTTNQLTIKLNK